MLKKKFIALLAAAAVFTGSACITASADSNEISGDVDSDGRVSASDSLRVLRYSVGLEKFTEKQTAKADINHDGVINSLDALIILRLSVSMPYDEAVVNKLTSLPEPAHGIDVSFWQEDIDFNKVRESGIDFVIIRAGGATDNPAENHPYVDPRRQGVDSCFEKNYANAKAAGLDVGVYWYSFAETVEQAKREAESCLKAIKGKQFEYPVFFDLENDYQFAKGVDFCSAITDTFCGTLRDNGYYTGFYMSTSYAEKYLNDDVKNKYDYWLAQWSGEVAYSGTYQMRQYSSTGRVNGVRGDVDLDRSYVDYPMYIVFNGFNNWN